MSLHEVSSQIITFLARPYVSGTLGAADVMGIQWCFWSEAVGIHLSLGPAREQPKVEKGRAYFFKVPLNNEAKCAAD